MENNKLQTPAASKSTLITINQAVTKLWAVGINGTCAGKCMTFYLKIDIRKQIEWLQLHLSLKTDDFCSVRAAGTATEKSQLGFFCFVLFSRICLKSDSHIYVDLSSISIPHVDAWQSCHRLASQRSLASSQTCATHFILLKRCVHAGAQRSPQLLGAP